VHLRSELYEEFDLIFINGEWGLVTGDWDTGKLVIRHWSLVILDKQQMTKDK
jgi:hypothetical protein